LVQTIDASWLFTRGRDSVRVERVSRLQQGLRLIVHGPGYEHEMQEFADEGECTSHQSLFERKLRALGFHLEAFSDRRALRDRRNAPRGRERRH
jgi:arylamine N-acetyltransferase